MIVGLAHLHKHHILHGDLKPLNILITEQNVVRVADRVEMETWRSKFQKLKSGDTTLAYLPLVS